MRIVIITKELTDNEVETISDDLGEACSDIIGGLDNHTLIIVE